MASAAAQLADDDLALARRIAGGDRASFEVLMRRHNPRLFRVARAILKNDAEAEDALQDAYLSAFRALPTFAGASALGTWLTRIVINSALGRLRSRGRDQVLHAFDAPRDLPDEHDDSPEWTAIRAQMLQLLERNIDALPLAFRTVFMMREVEEMSVEETAASLSIPEATVRSRLHRARAQLRASLATEMDMAAADVFRFLGARCDRIVARVLAQLQD